MDFFSKLTSLNHKEGFMPRLASWKRCEGVPGSDTGCPEGNQAKRFTWHHQPICHHCIERWQQQVEHAESDKAGERVVTEIYDRYGRVDIRWRPADTNEKWRYLCSTRIERGANVGLIPG